MQNELLARALATMMAATAAVSTASVPMMIAPIVAMAETAKATITVKNVEAGATVKAYQLVKGEYDASGKLTKYEVTDLAKRAQFNGNTVTVDDLAVYSAETKTGTTQTDTTANLAAWTAAVAAKVTSSDTADYTLTKDDSSAVTSDDGTTYTYKVDAKPGLYLVLVTKDDTDTTYNPVLLAVNVSDADNVSMSISGNTEALDLTTKFQNGTTTAYVKKVTNGLKKSIVKTYADEQTTSDVKGVSAAVGDEITFKLSDMKIPSYSGQYTSPKYEITDTLEANCFEGITDLTVKVGGDVVAAGDTTFKLTATDGTTDLASSYTEYQISFTEAYMTANAGKAVEITYKAKVASTATNNFAENYNHAKLEYNYIKTDLTQATKTVVDNAYVYTFGVDTNLNSEGEGGATRKDYVDYTLNKVTEKVGGDKFEAATTDDGKTTGKSPNALEGAKFTLYSDSKCENKAACNQTESTSTSDKLGHITFTGLNANTDYYLKETTAPTGYTVNSTIYKINIVPTINETTGIMSEYTINVYESTDNGSTFGSTPVGKFTIKATIVDNTIDKDTGNIPYSLSDHTIIPVEIVDTVLQQLPFTGGEGRYAIYIGSVALAALVVVLLIVKRRREEQE